MNYRLGQSYLEDQYSNAERSGKERLERGQGRIISMRFDEPTVSTFEVPKW